MKSIRSSLAFIVLLTASTLSAADKKMWAESILGKKAPELKVQEWLTPAPDTKGKFVMIDFWATWCGPCRKAIPELNGYQQKFKDKLVVIGISDEAREKVAAFSEPKPLYSLAIDRENATAKSIKVEGIPHVLLIDPEGIVRWEGYPFLEGYELSETVVADVIARYGAAKR